MNEKRVVVTGLGAITPLGNNVETLWSNIKEGKSGIDYITRVDKDEFPVSVAAEVTDFDPSDYMEKKEARKMDLFADRKSTRLNSSHVAISYAVFCLKKKQRRK